MSNLVIYDIDETLFHTTAKIMVVGDSGVKYLSNAEFNTYKLQPDEYYDFTEFSNSELFYNDSTPITNQINNLKSNIRSGDDVYLVTARSNFNDKDLFLDTFRKHDIAIDSIRVER